MKITIRNLLSLVCALVLLEIQVLPSYTYADEVSSAAVIGKVTYLLGQADVTQADGSVLPLALQMDIPDGSRIQVKERSRVSLLMIDGGIEKLGPGTVFTFNKYTYDPDDPQATEIRKTLQEGEVTSTTGRGGEDAKERYRMNSPLAAIAVLGTEYTVKVSNGETWVTVHSGEISIAKLGGNCQRSGLGACAGGERLSEGQRGLALVVRAGDPKPILMPATAIPVSENKPATPPAKEAEKAEPAAAAEKSTASDTSTKAEAEPQKNTESASATPPPTSASSATTDAGQIAEKVSSSPEPKAIEKASPIASPTSVIEKPPVATAADERNPLDTMSTVAAVSTPERTPSVTLESTASNLTTSTISAIQQQEAIGGNTTTKAKQSLVQSSNTVVSLPAIEKSPVATVVATPAPAVEPIPAVPEKPKVATVTVVTPPVVADPVPEKPKVATVTVVPPVVADPIPEKPKVETVVVAPPAAEPVPVVPEQPKVATVTVVPPIVAEPVPEKPTVAVVVSPPPILATPTTTPPVSEVAAPTVNWGKYDPTATVDGKTSFSEQVGSSYTQLLQPATASPSNLGLQQNPSVSLPEPDKRDVGVALDNAVAPVVAPVNNADAGKTTPLSSSASTLRNDDTTPQTPLITAPLTTAAPLTTTVSTGLSAEAVVLDRTSGSPLAPPLTPLTLTPPLASP